MPHGGDASINEQGMWDPAPLVLRPILAYREDTVAKFNNAFPQISHKTSDDGRASGRYVPVPIICLWRHNNFILRFI